MRLTSDSFMMSPFSRASTRIESRSMVGSPEVSEARSERHPPPTNSRAPSAKREVYFIGRRQYSRSPRDNPRGVHIGKPQGKHSSKIARSQVDRSTEGVPKESTKLHQPRKHMAEPWKASGPSVLHAPHPQQ